LNYTICHQGYNIKEHCKYSRQESGHEIEPLSLIIIDTELYSTAKNLLRKSRRMLEALSIYAMLFPTRQCNAKLDGAIEEGKVGLQKRSKPDISY
jgi:hypothetical protein